MRAIVLLLPFFMACSDNLKLTRVSGKDEFQQAPDNSVDILWVIDNSVSMQNEQEAVAAGAQDFLKQLEVGNMDFHLGVITTDVDSINTNSGVLMGNPNYVSSDCASTGNTSCYATAFQKAVLQGTSGSDQERGLEAVLTALGPPLVDTRNSGFLRDEAALAIVMVSDENDCSDFGAMGSDGSGEDCYTHAELLTPVEDIVSRIKSLKADSSKISFSGIIGPKLDDPDYCEQSYPGTRYYNAAALLNGVTANICETDYSSIMDKLGLVAAGILTTFQLSKAAVENDNLVVTVTPIGGDPVIVPKDDASGWTYLADYAQIRFNGDSVPERGATILVEYDVAGPVPTAPTDTASP